MRTEVVITVVLYSLINPAIFIGVYMHIRERGGGKCCWKMTSNTGAWLLVFTCIWKSIKTFCTWLIWHCYLLIIAFPALPYTSQKGIQWILGALSIFSHFPLYEPFTWIIWHYYLLIIAIPALPYTSQKRNPVNFSVLLISLVTFPCINNL